MRVWRICRRKYVETAYTGEGTQKAGGRWTPKGVSAIYTAGSLSLAALEMLVKFNEQNFPAELVAIPAEVPDNVERTVYKSEDLPRNWRELPPPIALQEIGKTWLSKGETAVLSVPSAVIPVENNFLLNPGHPDFAGIRIRAPMSFSFDPRLMGGRAG